MPVGTIVLHNVFLVPISSLKHKNIRDLQDHTHDPWCPESSFIVDKQMPWSANEHGIQLSLFLILPIAPDLIQAKN